VESVVRDVLYAILRALRERLPPEERRIFDKLVSSTIGAVQIGAHSAPPRQCFVDTVTDGNRIIVVVEGEARFGPSGVEVDSPCGRFSVPVPASAKRVELKRKEGLSYVVVEI
jgi:hypothetical protein